MLDTLVLSEQECFQRTSERVVGARLSTEVSRQRIPEVKLSNNVLIKVTDTIMSETLEGTE